MYVMYAIVNQNNVEATASEWEINPHFSRALNYLYVGIFLLLVLLQYWNAA